jgi:hypothetical protein
MPFLILFYIILAKKLHHKEQGFHAYEMAVFFEYCSSLTFGIQEGSFSVGRF